MTSESKISQWCVKLHNVMNISRVSCHTVHLTLKSYFVSFEDTGKTPSSMTQSMQTSTMATGIRTTVCEI